MRDYGPAFDIAAKELKMKHLLCAHHFQSDALKAQSGLAGDGRTAFLNEVIKAIFHDFETSNLF